MWPAVGAVVASFVVLLFQAFGVVRFVGVSCCMVFRSGFPINWIIFPLLNE
jgi:hypothetical protein